MTYKNAINSFIFLIIISLQNQSHIAISFGPEEEKVKCRAMLKKDYPSLKNETKEQFKKMFDDTQVVFDVNRGAIVMINRKIFWI